MEAPKFLYAFLKIQPFTWGNEYVFSVLKHQPVNIKNNSVL